MDVLDKTGLGTLWNKIKSFAYSKAQTDSLLGGKVGTSDTIPGERVGKIRWGKHVANGVFPVSMGMIAGANRLIFLDAQYIEVEYSTDSGTTWTDYGLTDGQKRFIFSDIGFNCYLGHHPTNPGDGDRLRITVTAPTGTVSYYAQLQEFYIFHNTVNNTSLEGRILTKDFDAGSWSVRTEWLELTGYSGGADISTAAFPFGTYNSSSAARLNHVEKIMFEFRQTVKPGNGSSALVSYIRAYGLNLWSSGGVGMRGTGHLYAYDALQNATFPAEVRATRLVTGGGTDAQLVTGTGGLLAKSSLAAASHTHSRSQITDFDHDHDDAYAAKSHTHTTDDVTNLSLLLSGKADAVRVLSRSAMAVPLNSIALMWGRCYEFTNTLNGGVSLRILLPAVPPWEQINGTQDADMEIVLRFTCGTFAASNAPTLTWVPSALWGGSRPILSSGATYEYSIKWSQCKGCCLITGAKFD